MLRSHQEAECEILLRTRVGLAMARPLRPKRSSEAGALAHAKPLSNDYLHKTVRRNLVAYARSSSLDESRLRGVFLAEVKEMGSKAKYDKLAGHLGADSSSFCLVF